MPTMSIESTPKPFSEREQLLTFPIIDTTIGDSIAWLSYFYPRSEANLRIEEEHLKTTDPALATYVKSMGVLREHTQLTEDQLNKYRQGAFFGINLLSAQFRRSNPQLPKVNESALATYFKSLISGPRSKQNQDIQYLTLVSMQPGMLKKPITPTILSEMFKKNSSDKLLLRIKETFEKNTNEKLTQLWSDERDLAKALPAIANLIGEKQRGFYVGLMDVYWPFNMDAIIGPYAEILDDEKF